jgi:hypothetical protein
VQSNRPFLGAQNIKTDSIISQGGFSMSTTDKKYGFVPVKHLTGGQIRSREYHVDSSNGTAIFIGDLVDQEADGNIAPAAAAAGTSVVGVAVGCKDSNRNAIAAGYLAASTEGYIDVVDDPDVIFKVQEDGAGGTPLAASDIGATRDHVQGTGDTATGRSAHTIDSSGTEAQLKIIGLHEDPNNLWGDTYTEVLVIINEHQYRGAVAGV